MVIDEFNHKVGDLVYRDTEKHRYGGVGVIMAVSKFAGDAQILWISSEVKSYVNFDQLEKYKHNLRKLYEA